MTQFTHLLRAALLLYLNLTGGCGKGGSSCADACVMRSNAVNVTGARGLPDSSGDVQEACKVSLTGCLLAQVFWPAAVNTSRKFALGEVWHNAIASELVLYNASNKCAPSGSLPLVPSHSCSWDLTTGPILLLLEPGAWYDVTFRWASVVRCPSMCVI